MSERNGDRARFQKDRKRKLRRRQRIQELFKALRRQSLTPVGPSVHLLDAREAPRREVARQKKEAANKAAVGPRA
ncbi:MAG: hypothetical protein HY047_17915 [Acidobacteria bacterium]|nr:hypothetical protein [Acidobacteriota bacterium]